MIVIMWNAKLRLKIRMGQFNVIYAINIDMLI